MERLVRIAAVLKVAGHRGVAAEKLVKVAEFDGDDALDQLGRELTYLRRQGWRIETISPPGAPAIYRMLTVDNRLRVRLTPAQQRALQRAVLMADRSDLVERLGLPAGEQPRDVPPTLPLRGHDDRLTAALQAVRHRCLLRFRYAGKHRVVDPESVRSQNHRWYLRGREQGSDVVKLFVVTRMSDVQRDRPGSAERVAPEPTLALHPLRWQVDPPVDVTVRASPQHVPDVERWLGRPHATRTGGEAVELTYHVTNRSGLRARLFELGRRVEIVGPEEVRRELLAELTAAVKATSP